MMENNFYDIVLIKITFNRKSKSAVTLMDTEKLAKYARKAAYKSTRLHSNSFKINTGK